jgi:4-amino-4-deoxy-L-arabinose transferase-like glycosyltransferase
MRIVSDRGASRFSTHPWDLLAVSLVALALRSIHLWEIVGTPFFEALSSDAAVYDRLAQDIAAGDVLLRERGVYYLGPLYPYLLALVRLVTGASSVGIHGLQVLLSTATAAAICHLGQRLFGRGVGLMAGMATAAFGTLIFYSGVPLPTTLVVFLNLATVMLLVEALRAPSRGRWLATGLALGLAATARGNALLFAPFLAGAIIAAFGLVPWRRWAAATAWVALGTVLVIAPVTLRNAVVGGELVVLTTNLGTNFYLGNHASSDGLYLSTPVYRGRHMGVTVGAQYQSFRAVARAELRRPDLGDAEVSRFWVGRTIDEIRSAPGQWLKLLGRKAYYYAAAFEVPNNRSYEFSKRFSFLLRAPLFGWGVVFPLAMLGIYATRRTWRDHAPLLGFLLAHFLALVAFFVTARYRLAAAPVLVLYAAVGVRQLSVWAREGDARSLLASGAAVLMLGFWLQAFEPAINFATRFENLGRAYEAQGRTDEALSAYDEGLAIAPQRPYGNYWKGRLLRELGRSDDARPFLLRALNRARATGDARLAGRVREELELPNP